nr:hypothetical protein GCM10020185_78080 [Pseudomonas brassicacearum subsp. brassicacearum]
MAGRQDRYREGLRRFQAAVADRLALERHAQGVLRAQGVAWDVGLDALWLTIGSQLLRADQEIIEKNSEATGAVAEAPGAAETSTTDVTGRRPS